MVKLSQFARFAVPKVGLALDYADDGDHWSGQHVLVDQWLNRPPRWRKSRVVATGWLGDMWGWGGDDGFDARDDVLTMAFCDEYQKHQYLHLTKQAELMAEHLSNYVSQMRYGFPRNQWWGATITNQRDADERISPLLRILGRRWLCIEPMRGPVDLEHAFAMFDRYGEPNGPRCDQDGSSMISWVVVGQETGPGARPARPEWVQSVIDQCADVGVPVWTKALPAGVHPVRQAPPEIASILRSDRCIVAEAARLGVEVEG